MSTVQAAGVRWDLSPLFDSPDAARGSVEPALERSRAFEARWRGTVDGITPAHLAEALAELGAIENLLSRISSYSMLRKAVDVTSEENRDLGAAVEAAVVQAQNALRFFELEWLALDDEQATRLVDRLERDGLVERSACASDARGSFAVITPAGRQRLDEALGTHVRDLRRRFLSRFTPEEQEQLAGFWARIDS